MSERRTIKVHPNSTAAKKWRRQSWQTSLSQADMRSPAADVRYASRAAVRRVFARAAMAERRGDHVQARNLRRQAMALHHAGKYVCG